MKRVHVRVPATSANIGPGFDSLGVALTLYARFECEIIGSGLEITGCPEIYRNEDNLFVRAYRRAEREIGVAPAPIRVHIDTDVPVSRGLGSSASLWAGGVSAANALNGSPLSREKLVELCNELEGHPDNIGFIALIPNFETETKAMRAVLPKEIPFADAVFNSSRLAVMLHGFERGRLDLIAKALDDRLHQPYRRHLIHEFPRAEAAAMAAGCAAFCISGSGSTCLGVCEAEKAEEIARNVQAALEGSQYEWRVLALTLDHEGSVCTLF